MLKITNPYKMVFKNDDDFYRFCVVPVLVVRTSTDNTTGEPFQYTDFDFTQEYNDAVARGVKFVIKDDNSEIYKRGCVSYRTITKPVSNIVLNTIYK